MLPVEERVTGVFENEDALLATPRLILLPKAGGFPPLRETPRLVYRERQGVPPQDLEGGLSGYWLVSERLRQVMEEIDPDAFVFAGPPLGRRFKRANLLPLRRGPHAGCLG